MMALLGVCLLAALGESRDAAKINRLLDDAENARDPSSAATAYRKVLKLQPTSCIANVNLGQAYAQMGNAEGASRHFILGGEYCDGENAAMAYHNAG